MGAPDDGGIEQLVAAAVSAHGEEAVRRALKLAPMLSLVRDSGDFYLDTAARAAGTEGVPGALVLELPRKSNQPTEVTFVGGKPTFSLTT